MSEEEHKSTQLALEKLPFEDRMTLAKSLKKAVEQTSDIEEQRYYKTRIRELFTDEEWEELKERKKANERRK